MVSDPPPQQQPGQVWGEPLPAARKAHAGVGQQVQGRHPGDHVHPLHQPFHVPHVHHFLGLEQRPFHAVDPGPHFQRLLAGVEVPPYIRRHLAQVLVGYPGDAGNVVTLEASVVQPRAVERPGDGAGYQEQGHRNDE